MEFKLYRCAHCGNIAWKLVDKGVSLFCCGEAMQEMVPNTTDGALEKHVPVVERTAHGQGSLVTVKVGAVEHPMLSEHYIQIIAAVDGDTVTVRRPHPGQKPELTVAVTGEKVEAIEYCNLHGLWKGEG